MPGGDRTGHGALGTRTHTCALRACRCPGAASPVRAPGRCWSLSSPRPGQQERGSGPSRSGCSPRSLHLCFVPDPWCVPRRDRNSLLPALHNSLPTPLLPGHCIWSPGWLPPSAPAAPWIRELLFFQRKSCFPSQRWGWRAGQGGSLSTEHLLSGGRQGDPSVGLWWLTGGLVEKITCGGWQVLHFPSQGIALLVGMQGMGPHPSLHPLFWRNVLPPGATGDSAGTG